MTTAVKSDIDMVNSKILAFCDTNTIERFMSREPAILNLKGTGGMTMLMTVMTIEVDTEDDANDMNVLMEFIIQQDRDKNRGACMNMTNDKGQTCFMLACKFQTLPVIEYLLENGASINGTDTDGNTCLHLAIRKKNLPVVKMLLTMNCSSSTKNALKQTPLSVAKLTPGCDDIIACLENERSKPMVDLHRACRHASNLSIFNFYLKKYANSVEKVNNKVGGKTPLHCACEAGLMHVVRWLVKNDADQDVVDRDGKTPLQLAKLHNFQEIANFLSIGEDGTSVIRASIERFPEIYPPPPSQEFSTFDEVLVGMATLYSTARTHPVASLILNMKDAISLWEAIHDIHEHITQCNIMMQSLSFEERHAKKEVSKVLADLITLFKSNPENSPLSSTNKALSSETLQSMIDPKTMKSMRDAVSRRDGFRDSFIDAVDIIREMDEVDFKVKKQRLDDLILAAKAMMRDKLEFEFGAVSPQAFSIINNIKQSENEFQDLELNPPNSMDEDPSSSINSKSWQKVKEYLCQVIDRCDVESRKRDLMELGANVDRVLAILDARQDALSAQLRNIFNEQTGNVSTAELERMNAERAISELGTSLKLFSDRLLTETSLSAAKSVIGLIAMTFSALSVSNSYQHLIDTTDVLIKQCEYLEKAKMEGSLLKTTAARLSTSQSKEILTLKWNLLRDQSRVRELMDEEASEKKILEDSLMAINANFVDVMKYGNLLGSFVPEVEIDIFHHLSAGEEDMLRVPSRYKSEFTYAKNILTGSNHLQLYTEYLDEKNKYVLKEYRLSNSKTFFREAKTLAALKHTNIVELLAIVHEDKSTDTKYLMFKWYENGDLNSWWTKKCHGEFATYLNKNQNECSLILHNLSTSILDALDYMHSLGIVHCDIKPMNILIDDDEQPLITDFDISSNADERGTSIIARTKTSQGTLGYIAPELMVSGTKIPSKCADVYSFGVTLLWMLQGGTIFPPGHTPVCEYSDVMNQEWFVNFDKHRTIMIELTNMIKSFLSPLQSRPNARLALRHEFFRVVDNEFGTRDVVARRRLFESCPSRWSAVSDTCDVAQWVDVTDEYRSDVAKLMMESARFDLVHLDTFDRHGIDYCGFEILSIKRAESPGLWQSYCAEAETSYVRSHKCIPSLDVEPKLTSLGYLQEKLGLKSKEVGEHLFFHGTTQYFLNDILQYGLDSRFNKRGLFGNASYFAESSTKADMYTCDNNGNDGVRVMIIARVCLGNYAIALKKRLGETLPPKIDGVLRDSVVAPTTATHSDAILSMYREFAVFERQKSFPELVIEYRHIVNS
eukprot:m.64067 g.64067  ORF g.64067 m.64067 type:complete len:1296 (-) comp8098_c1_seq2:44-3931(-)